MADIKSIFRLTSLERLFNNIIASILLLGMMLLVVCDVAGRYLFNQPVQGTLEVTEFIMVAVVFFTLAHTQAIKAHIKVDLLIERMPRRMRLALELIISIFGLVIFALIAWQGFLSALDSWEIQEKTDGLIPFPIFPAKLTIPIGCILLCLRFMADIVEVLRELTRKGAQ